MNTKEATIIKKLINAGLTREELKRTIQGILLNSDANERFKIFDDLVKNGGLSEELQRWLAVIIFNSVYVAPTVVIQDSDKGNNYADLEEIITTLLHELGVPANIKGYKQLKEAILLVIEDEEYLHPITKNLYPAIAEKFGDTTTNVEKSMRNAIKKAFDRGNNNKILNVYFANTIDSHKGKPTTSEFIAIVADKLRLRYKKS